jgi:hypothetical protein
VRTVTQCTTQLKSSHLCTPLQLNATMSVKAAIQELESADLGEELSHRKLAEKHGITRLTLTRQVNGVHASRQDNALN